jgi:hypothetical protein
MMHAQEPQAQKARAKPDKRAQARRVHSPHFASRADNRSKTVTIKETDHD